MEAENPLSSRHWLSNSSLVVPQGPGTVNSPALCVRGQGMKKGSNVKSGNLPHEQNFFEGLHFTFKIRADFCRLLQDMALFVLI